MFLSLGRKLDSLHLSLLPHDRRCSCSVSLSLTTRGSLTLRWPPAVDIKLKILENLSPFQKYFIQKGATEIHRDCGKTGGNEIPLAPGLRLLDWKIFDACDPFFEKTRNYVNEVTKKLTMSFISFFSRAGTSLYYEYLKEEEKKNIEFQKTVLNLRRQR